MNVMVIGATGTIGKAVVQALTPRHTVIPVSHSSTEHKVDLADPASIKHLYVAIGRVDAVICAAGDARFGPLAQLTDADYNVGLHNKLMGQVNLVRFGFDHVADGGSITVTSGVLARSPMPGSSAISLVNAGLEGFVRAAALEAPRNIRVNVVSPGWVTVTLKALGMDPSKGATPEVVAQAYVRSLEGSDTGVVLEPKT